MATVGAVVSKLNVEAATEDTTLFVSVALAWIV
jgi:hypothetical protein